MVIVMPARWDDRASIPTDRLGNVIEAIGTNRYGMACLDLFERSFDIEHWAAFRYRSVNSVDCIATASRAYVAAALGNINRFVMRCHTVDPSLIALKESHLEQPCVTRLAIGDIGDRQYRNCFESAHVEERLSFFSRLGADLRQISIYGGARKRNVSAVELKHYSALASLVLATAFKLGISCQTELVALVNNLRA